MTTTHEMTPKTLWYPIHTKKLGDKIRIRFLGDVHYSAPGCDRDAFNSVLDMWKEDNENAFYITMGDLNDFASASEKKALMDVHESTLHTFNDVARAQCDELCEKLMFMKGKFIGSVEGNHSWVFQDMGGISSDQYVAQRLGGYWLGGLGVIRLLAIAKSKKYSVDMALHHGKSGGQTVGNSFNQVDKMRNVVDADIYVMGHNHQIGAVPGHSILRIKDPANVGDKTKPITDLGFRERNVWLGRSGSFLRSYADGRPGYAVKSLYSPAQLGALEVTIQVRRNCKNGQDTMYHVINGSVVR